jgi:hypothetical protein
MSDLIGWEQRAYVGVIRAYLGTLVETTFAPRRLVSRASRPVSYAAAQRFRWLTIALATVAIGATASAWWWQGQRPLPGTKTQLGLRSEELLARLWFDPGFVAVTGAGLAVGLALATGIPSYFFHPKRLDVVRQNRAVALSYYGCGPLAWGVVLSAITFGCQRLRIDARDWVASGTADGVARFATVLLPLVLLVSLANLGYLIKALTETSVLGAAIRVIIIGVGWVVVFCACIAAAHMMATLAALVWSARG